MTYKCKIKCFLGDRRTSFFVQCKNAYLERSWPCPRGICKRFAISMHWIVIQFNVKMPTSNDFGPALGEFARLKGRIWCRTAEIQKLTGRSWWRSAQRFKDSQEEVGVAVHRDSKIDRKKLSQCRDSKMDRTKLVSHCRDSKTDRKKMVSLCTEIHGSTRRSWCRSAEIQRLTGRSWCHITQRT